jgi:SPP1 gp7 family putative phage head morphogenesis protein
MAKSKNIGTSQQPHKNPANEPHQIVLQKIEVRKNHRTEWDIPKWRNAIKSAEALNPRRNLLYNLYADVELDGHVQSVASKRKDNVVSANWQFVNKDGEPVDAINQLIDTIGFDDLLNEIVASKFWSYSILEPKFWKSADDTWEMSAGLLPRLHYRQEMGIVTYNAMGDDGINIREGKYAKTIMEVGTPSDLGLYAIAAVYQILKRGGIGDYAAFIQTFGNPIIDAVWDGFDEGQKKALSDALQGLGAGGNIIRPAGTTIDIKENNVKNTGDAHGSFLSFLNKEISKALLGSTETTESSSSSGYAQSQTHSEQDDRKHENDISFTRKILNSRFIRVMQAYGFDTEGGRFVVQGEDTELSKKDMFAMHEKMATTLGMPVDYDWMYETYGMQKPEDYDAQIIAKQQKAQELDKKAEKPNAAKKGEEKEEVPTKSKKEEKEQEVTLSFFNKLKLLFQPAPAVTTGAMSCNHHTINLSEEQTIDSLVLINKVWNEKGKYTFDADWFYQTASILNQGFKDGFDEGNEIMLSDNPSFTYGFNDPVMLASFERSLYRFAGQKNIAIIQQLNQLYRQSTSFEDFYAQAFVVVNIANKDWLQTEFTTANRTGNAASTYARLIGRTDIFPFWKYTTIGDGRVRESHSALEGIILKWDDPLWQKLFPPNGWNCRCSIVPRMEHEVDKSKLVSDKAKAQAYINSPVGIKDFAAGWGANQVANGEVFTDAQQYNSKFDAKMLQELQDLKAENFGLRNGNDLSSEARTPLPEQAELPAEGLGIRDYQNRPITVNSTGNLLLFSAMQKALAAPDEVWLTGKALGEMIYIKYFLGKPMVVIAEVSAKNTIVKEYLTVENIEQYRKGLLILKP